MSALATRLEELLKKDPAGRDVSPATREVWEEILRRERWGEEFSRRYPQPPDGEFLEVLDPDYRLKRMGLVGREEVLP